jgi:hypothetical protein
MNDALDISADTVRQHLLSRAEAYRKATGTSFSTISKEAVKDDRFLARAMGGANFTIETYQKVIDWLDAAERGERAA